MGKNKGKFTLKYHNNWNVWETFSKKSYFLNCSLSGCDTSKHCTARDNMYRGTRNWKGESLQKVKGGGGRCDPSIISATINLPFLKEYGDPRTMRIKLLHYFQCLSSTVEVLLIMNRSCFVYILFVQSAQYFCFWKWQISKKEKIKCKIKSVGRMLQDHLFSHRFLIFVKSGHKSCVLFLLNSKTRE